MTDPDWYYEQGAPDPEDEELDVCGGCDYRNCQCDAAHDYYQDLRND